MDRPILLDLDVIRVERLADDVPHVSERLDTDRNLERRAGVAGARAATETVGRLHADRFHDVVTDVLRDLGDDRVGSFVRLTRDLERGIDLGQVLGWELDVDDGADDVDDAPFGPLGRLLCFLFSDRHSSPP